MVGGLMRGQDETPNVAYWFIGDSITSPEDFASDIVMYATECPSLRDGISRD
jgi:hypothetical protein